MGHEDKSYTNIASQLANCKSWISCILLKQKTATADNWRMIFIIFKFSTQAQSPWIISSILGSNTYKEGFQAGNPRQ